MSGKDFSLVGRLRELREMGCARIIVVLSHCGAASAKGRQLLAALSAAQPLPDTTIFNYARGLS
jgi:hypothetical protein